VNRPFYAIGVLLAFLAVAMMAVGLSSRPTSRPASAQSGSGITKPRRGPGSAVFLLAVSDEVAEESAADLLVAEAVDDVAIEPCYSAGCGLDRCTGRVYRPLVRTNRTALKATVVALASEPATESIGPMDCLSHYDAAYDSAVYGAANGLIGDVIALPAEHSFDSDDQTLTLFRSLIGEPFEVRASVLPRAKSASRNWRYELNAWCVGAANQAWQSTERLGLADECQRWAAVFGLRAELNQVAEALPTWADYQDWCNSPQEGVAGQDTPAAGSAPFLSQPWRHVLQFAVSWLNHAAKTIGAAAELLGGESSLSASEPIGLRTTEFQPR
jgi:hypothetical protein